MTGEAGRAFKKRLDKPKADPAAAALYRGAKQAYLRHERK